MVLTFAYSCAVHRYHSLARLGHVRVDLFEATLLVAHEYYAPTTTTARGLGPHPSITISAEEAKRLKDLLERRVRWQPSAWWSWPNWPVELPLWIPFVTLAIPTAILWWRERRVQPGHCRQCGYDLTGNVSGRCPECGVQITSEVGRCTLP